MPVGVTPYVNVTDLAEKEQRITAAGGRIHKSKQEVPGMGWFTIFSDPDGNMLALWQPAAEAAWGADRGPRRKTGGEEERRPGRRLGAREEEGARKK
jgi:hypothetical protein